MTFKKEDTTPQKTEILWRPVHNSDNRVELTDSVITNVPDTIGQESDPNSKVILALLAEILVLQDAVGRLNQVVNQTVMAGAGTGGGGGTTVSLPADETGQPTKEPIGGRQAGFGQPVPELRDAAQAFRAQAEAKTARENAGQ